MKAFYCDRFPIPLPEWHRFPIQKYRRLRERIEESVLIDPEDLLVPPAATDDQLQTAHDPDYVRKVIQGGLSRDEVRAMGFPWSPLLVERSRRSVGATIEAARFALGGDGVAVNLAGGTHHAYRDHAAGFCVFNDTAVASRVLQAEGLVQKILIIDADVHQGDGTASIFDGDPTVFTFSIHGALNYPLEKQTSDLDIELDDGTEDAAYLEALDQGLKQTLERIKPDLAFYLAGADPLAQDQLGRLKVTKAGLIERDRRVLRFCREQGLPVAVVMAGGYAEEVEDTVDVHYQTVSEAVEAAKLWSIESGRTTRGSGDSRA